MALAAPSLVLTRRAPLSIAASQKREPGTLCTRMREFNTEATAYSKHAIVGLEVGPESLVLNRSSLVVPVDKALLYSVLHSSYVMDNGRVQEYTILL